MVMTKKVRHAADQSIQAQQYSFPYHYVPENGKRLFLSRHLGFAPSYMAALGFVAERLRHAAQDAGTDWQHVDTSCGDGALIHYLSRMHGFSEAKMTGVDKDLRALEWARIFNPDVDFRACDIAALDGGFTSASLVEVIEHVSPTILPELIANAAGLLRRGGLLLVTVPSVEKTIASKHF